MTAGLSLSLRARARAPVHTGPGDDELPASARHRRPGAASSAPALQSSTWHAQARSDVHILRGTYLARDLSQRARARGERERERKRPCKQGLLGLTLPTGKSPGTRDPACTPPRERLPCLQSENGGVNARERVWIGPPPKVVNVPKHTSSAETLNTQSGALLRRVHASKTRAPTFCRAHLDFHLSGIKRRILVSDPSTPSTCDELLRR